MILNVCHGNMDEVEQGISDLEDKLTENNQAEKKMETKAKEHDTRITEISDSLKRNNIRTIRGPRRGRERERDRRVM